jgi:hypothetical protein
MQTPTDYCANELRRQNYPHYLIPLLLPRDLRPRLWALYGFNLELMQVKFAARELTLQALRYQWWREAIERLFAGKIDAHPVLQALGTPPPAPESAFEALIVAHETEKGVEEALAGLVWVAVDGEYHNKINILIKEAQRRADSPLLPLYLWAKALIS